MEAFNAWWAGLTLLNQSFFVAALFFSVFLLWQLFGALVGVAGGAPDVDTHVEPDWSHATPSDAHDTLVAFKLLSVRSLLAFFTLFAWGGALYLSQQRPIAMALTYALVWGVVAMILVSALMHFLGRMTESGNLRIGTCVGAAATVYLDIPADGEGEIRVACNGILTHLKARPVPGAAGLKAGAAVRVRRVLGPNCVEVERATVEEEKKEAMK
jgi:membrane protein implicated in regulation of membrane protease activity